MSSLTLILLSALIGLFSYLYWKAKQNLTYWQRRGIACEEPNFFLGNITGIETKRSFADIWMTHYKKFKGTGPFSGFYWFQRPAVFVLDTALAKAILIKEFNKFINRGFYSNEQDDPLTGTLFLLDGHKWRHMRNKLSPTFTSGKMKYMFPTVIKIGEEFVRVANEEVSKNSVVEVKNLFARFTMDVIGNCAFGIDCNSLKDADNEFLKMGKKVFSDTRHGRLAIAFMGTFQELSRKLHIKQTPQHVEDFYMRIVRDTVAYREQNNIRRNDFMDMLIDLKNNKMLKSEDGEELKNLTLEELAAQAFVFLIAGFETSSTTLGFALYELAQHPHIQQKVRDEVVRVLEQHNNEFSYECMKEMTYLDQVISETLRLYTVLPVLNRECLEDYDVPDNPKYSIKKGMQVLIPAAAMHRDADIYPNPNEFNPDNFTAEKVKERDSIEFLPFGDGPRNCVGLRFGMMQSRIGLALILKNFKFSTCEQTQIPLKYDKKIYLVGAEGGIYLKAEKI